MITGQQIRAARAILKWSARELSASSGVGAATIQRFEQQDGVPEGRSHTLLALQKALEAAGVEFIGSPDNAPGVCLVGPKKA
jgi:transcriptional regulator with XRE-family HTH domain